MTTFYAKKQIVCFRYENGGSTVLRSRDKLGNFVIVDKPVQPATYDPVCIAILDNQRAIEGDYVYVTIKNSYPSIHKIVESYMGFYILESGMVVPGAYCKRILAINKVENIDLLPLIQYELLYKYIQKSQVSSDIYVGYLSKIDLPKWILRLINRLGILSSKFEVQLFYTNVKYVDAILK